MKQGDKAGTRDEGRATKDFASLLAHPCSTSSSLVPSSLPASLLLILLLLTGCASGAQDDPNAPNVAFRLEEYQSAPNAYLYGGLVNVRYALSVVNRTKEPVTLLRVELRTVSSGAYTLRPTSTPVNVDLAPGQEKTIPLSLWAIARGGTIAATEPVTIRGAAYLTAPSGAFVRLFTQYFTEQ